MSEYNSHRNPLFIRNRLLKLDNIIQLIFDFTNKNLPEDLCDLFDFTVDVHNYNTRCVMNKGLFIPSIQILAINLIKVLKSYPDILSFNHNAQLKLYLKKIYNSKYISVV